MIAVITGDIINSRDVSPEVWLPLLKNTLQEITNNNKHWEIYRGDSFQVEITDCKNAFLAAVTIKAAIKTIKQLDVRLAIGIGHKTHQGASVAEASGSAFIFSGETLERLKKEKVNLAIKTNNEDFDASLNLCFKLALIAMDNWTANSAEIVKLSLKHPNLSQTALGAKIGIKQNTVSERQKRAYLQEILELNVFFKQKTTALTT